MFFFHHLEVSAWNSQITTLCPQNPLNKFMWLDPKCGRGSKMWMWPWNSWGWAGWKWGGKNNDPKCDRGSQYFGKQNLWGLFWIPGVKERWRLPFPCHGWITEEPAKKKGIFFPTSQEMGWSQKMQPAQFWMDLLINRLLLEKLGSRSHFSISKRRRSQCKDGHLTSICF